MTKYQPFPETHWSLVTRAGLPDQAARLKALEILLDRYLPALRSYLRIVQHLSEEDADELLQSFIADRILEHELISCADASKGRFRSFLLTSLRNFAVSMRRKGKVQSAVSLDDTAHENRNPASDVAVQAVWARALIHGAIHAMEEECRSNGRTDVWQVFEERILAEIFEGQPPTEYEELADRLNLSSPISAANLLVTAKRMYDRMLRTAVAEYVLDDKEIDEEIADLWRILAGSPAYHDEPLD